MIYIIGPGHGGPSLVAHAYLEGTYSEVYPNISQDAEGMQRLFKQFSFPGGIPSHVAPETPGRIHEGGELGYALSPRLRRRVRQPGSDRRLRRRRRRGRDRPAGHRLALATSSSTRPATARAADPAPQRLQDRQPLLPRPHPPRRAAEVLRGLWATSRTSSRGTIRRRCISSWPATLDTVVAEIQRDPGRRAQRTAFASGPPGR